MVSADLGNIFSVLHHHHAAEDYLLWPMLRARVSLSEQDVARMQDEHAAIAEPMENVQSLRKLWAATADSELAEKLIAPVNDLSARVDAHLEDEEQHIVPLINAHITAAEWQECLDRGAAFLTPKNVRFTLAFGGFALEDASADERRRFLAGIPCRRVCCCDSSASARCARTGPGSTGRRPLRADSGLHRHQR